MIFFKTDKQLKKEYKDSLREWYKKRDRIFLLFPRWLANGQLAWLQHVYRDYGIHTDQWGEYYIGEISYHLEE